MGLEAALTLPPTNERARIDREAGVLVGSRCERCGAVSWPGRSICHRCGAPAMCETRFAAEGQLLTFTTVWIARPGLEPPYTLGQVKLDDGPLVFGHVRGLPDGAVVPQRVRMAVAPGPETVPPFWFEPEEAR